MFRLKTTDGIQQKENAKVYSATLNFTIYIQTPIKFNKLFIKNEVAMLTSIYRMI